MIQKGREKNLTWDKLTSYCCIGSYALPDIARNCWASIWPALRDGGSLAVSRCLSLSLTVAHCLSLSLTVSRCLAVSLSLAVAHCLSPPLPVSRCLSLSLAVSRCLSLSIAVSRCLSVSLSLCLSLYLSLCLSVSHYLSLSLTVSHCPSLSEPSLTVTSRHSPSRRDCLVRSLIGRDQSHGSWSRSTTLPGVQCDLLCFAAHPPHPPSPHTHIVFGPALVTQASTAARIRHAEMRRLHCAATGAAPITSPARRWDGRTDGRTARGQGGGGTQLPGAIPLILLTAGAICASVRLRPAPRTRRALSLPRSNGVQPRNYVCTGEEPAGTAHSLTRPAESTTPSRATYMARLVARGSWLP